MKHCQPHLVFVAFLLFLPFAVSAEAPPDGDNPAAESEKSTLADKFKFFGYINVAYGETDHHQYRGATPDGSFKFRSAALQARFEATSNTEVVLQLANESVGESPSNEFRDDLELDWLFFRHRFQNGTSVRLGRVPLPIGIYNEIKDVGTALPFFRPSDNFYGEGTWTSDSVDGVVISHNFGTESGWDFNLDFYYGEWERIESNGAGRIYAVADITDAIGVFTWVTTPWNGVRVGFGYNEFKATGGAFLDPGVSDDEDTRYFSFDGTWDPVTFRFETSRRNFTGGYWNPYYAELSVQVASKVKLNAVYDVGKLYYAIPFFATFDDKIEELWGVSVNYEIRPGMVAKLEQRWTTTLGQVEDVSINMFFDEPLDIELTLVSVAFSF
jgi:hypothetical protein